MFRHVIGWLQIKGTRQLLVYADDFNILGGIAYNAEKTQTPN